jgi:hypothetical protein
MSEGNEPERTHEFPPEDLPPDIRVCNAVCGIGTHRTAEFPLHAKGLELINLLFQAIREDHELLANSRRRGWLTVRETEQSNAAPPSSHVPEHAERPTEGGKLNATEGTMNENAVCEVVHILAREPEVEKVCAILKPTDTLKLPSEEVLHGLYVVIRRALDSVNDESIF